MKISRRSFLYTSGALSLGAMAQSMLPWTAALADSLRSEAPVDVEILLRAKPTTASLMEGPATKVWSYEASLIHGPSSTIQSPGSGYLGPVIRLRQGQKVRIWFHNDLPESSIVHWHGLDVPHHADGHPMSAVGTGEVYQYDFEVINRAGLYWFHPHPHGRTGFQVYQGLAGLMVVEDAEEQALDLPKGDQELFYVLQDRELDEQNQLVYANSNHDWMMGKMGNLLFINGLRPEAQEVKKGSYRVRVLNGSNARFYNLAWSDGRELKIIGTDGGLIDKTETRDNVFMAPAERLDLWVDFSNMAEGETLSLVSAPIVEGRGEPFDLVQFKVVPGAARTTPCPVDLTPLEILDPSQAANLNNPKVWTLMPHRQWGWTLDGTPYDMNGVEDKAVAKLNDIEIWEFDHTKSGMAHPMHLHGSQFQVLERNGTGRFTGTFDLGWKDTVMMLPGDHVKVIKRFGRYPGRFLIHCHNLEHEDRAMMKNFDIVE